MLPQAEAFLKGLFCAERSKRNIERMAEQNNQNYQSQHHFLSESPWSAQRLMQRIGLDTNKLFGDPEEQVLSVDESSEKKAGKNSVGVSRQYNGNMGKTENSQTAVYLSLSSGDKVGLINTRLFLPDEWLNDPKRCKKAGIPPEAIVKKSKPQLAVDMIKETVDSGVKFGWVTADGLYGQSYEFCKALDEMILKFVVDVHRDQHVYLNDPAPYANPRSPKGKLITKETHIKVQDYYNSLDKSKDFEKVKIRRGTKGWIKADVHTVQVWVWNEKEQKARSRTLVIKKGDKLKFALSNIPVTEATPQEFAFKQGQRHWIERAFQDCKGELGMVEYQVRKFNAWYHHQALVMFALQFVNRKRIEMQKDIPLLSVRDVRLMLIVTLKEQGAQMENEINQMLVRHEQRIKDIERYYNENDYF